MNEVLPRVELGSLDSKSRVLNHYTTEPFDIALLSVPPLGSCSTRNVIHFSVVPVGG